MAYFNLGTHVAEIDRIIRSTDELLHLLKGTFQVDQNILKVVDEIISFINKLMKIMPNVMHKEVDFQMRNKELQNSAARVLESWGENQGSDTEFYSYWEEFKACWGEYTELIGKIDDSGDSIHLSLN